MNLFGRDVFVGIFGLDKTTRVYKRGNLCVR